VNGDSISYSVKIEELSLTGNQSYKKMAANKINWATVDDDKIKETNQKGNDTDEIIEL